MKLVLVSILSLEHGDISVSRLKDLWLISAKFHLICWRLSLSCCWLTIIIWEVSHYRCKDRRDNSTNKGGQLLNATSECCTASQCPMIIYWHNLSLQPLLCDWSHWSCDYLGIKLFRYLCNHIINVSQSQTVVAKTNFANIILLFSESYLFLHNQYSGVYWT